MNGATTQTENGRRAKTDIRRISTVQSATDTETHDFDANGIINIIRSGGKVIRPQVEAIRKTWRSELGSHGDYKLAKKAIDLAKKQLPAVTWSGTFTERANDKLVNHSGLLCADLDNLGPRLKDVREKLSHSPYVWAVFLSPSADGLKAVLRVPPDGSKHRGSFLAVEKHVKELTGVQIDEACKDVARLCFLSYDPEVFHNPQAVEIQPLAEPEKPRPINNGWVDLSARQRIAAEILGSIDWQSETSGVLTCPGKHLHTTGDGARDCMIDLDQVPTLHCFHNSCRGIVDGVNHEVRSRIGKAEHLGNGHEGRVDFPPFPRTNDEQPKKPDLKPEALYGLAGDIVRGIGPYTEAHDVALLLNTLAAFGNVTGTSAHATVQTTEHPGRLFVAQVGPTSKGRKDTGLSPIKYLFSLVDPDWSKNRIKTGLSSGEGLVFNVRDPIYKQEPIKEKGRVVDYQEVMVDPGESDKRLLVVEPEFASTLTVMGREGNTLSAVIRQAWDDGNLSPLTKNNPIRSTGAHVTLITFITSQELLSRLDDTSKGNGFANRFLWALVERSKELPEGAMVPERIITSLTDKLSQAVNFARRGGMVKRDEETRAAWAKVYRPLSAGRPGLTGAMLSRAEAQVLRLSVLYALLDRSSTITVDHLKGALAVWEYCEASTKAIFGNRLGDHTADRILDALRAAGASGLTDNEIYELFGRKRPAAERDRALGLLKDLGLAICQIVTTGGRPSTRWIVTEKGAK
jgi:BT4734-like, N-terminal domain/Protein of unknown function (DUF3987)